MDLSFFLAANSGQGFYSVYDDFPGEGQFLHIIKGGPGTGKSGFMKRIRAAAAERGLDTVSILCSGDPDSLDGLSVPALRQAWVDGTAPHVREPRVFGADADYVNLGQFCRTPLPDDVRAQAEALNRRYKSLYAAAYQLLSAAAALESAAEAPDPAVEREEMLRAAALLDRFPDRVGTGCRSERRFLSALSCRGPMLLEETLSILCKQIYVFRGSAGVLRRAAKHAARKASRLILCPSPLRPTELEAVLVPELSLALLRAPAAERVPSGERALMTEALALATEELREAKALHDTLEALYRPQMDFPALTSYTDSCLAALFST